MDPDPSLALDDAVRAFPPAEVLLSALYETRFGLTRKDLVEWAKAKIEVPVTHIPVRVDDDAVALGRRPHARRRHPDRRQPRPDRAPQGPGRGEAAPLHDHLPALGRPQREEVCERLARTLAELYRAEIDATGQPMSPEPFAAITERDRALPDRRDPDLDPRRPAVEVGRGGADRAGQGDHRHAGRALRVAGDGEAAPGAPSPPRRWSLMESASIPVRAAPGPRARRHHGPPEAHKSSRIDRQTLGILLFIVSEVMLFGAFFASYFFLRVVSNQGPWPPEGFDLPDLGRRRQHRDPGLVELHGPLGARVDPRRATAARCRWAWR